MGMCGVGDSGLRNLTGLTSLNVWSNEKVSDVNHMVKLRKLNANYYCGIGDSGVENLRALEQVYSRGNDRLTVGCKDIPQAEWLRW